MSIEKSINQLMIKTNGAIVYLRCSSKQQNELEKNQHGFDTQEQDCIDYCRENNLEILKTIKQTRRAHDISKLTFIDIPNMYSFVNLVLADPSRLSRNYAEATKFLYDCEQKQITLHFARDKLSSDNVADKKKILSLLIDANEESKVVSKRVKCAINQKKKFGSKLGAAHFGYELYRTYNDNFPILKERPLDKEQQIIQLIMFLLYGTRDIRSFTKLVREISGNANFRFSDSNILYGHYYPEDVAKLLNDWNISRRNKPWTTTGIRRIVQQYKQKPKASVKYVYEDSESLVYL